MAKAFSIASWNVEHFKQDPTRVDRVIDFVAAQNPDMLALYEVESKEVFASVTAKFPGYTFQITEGQETQEILVGVRASLSAFFTQKLEFKSGTTSMRPGLLATVTVAGKGLLRAFSPSGEQQRAARFRFARRHGHTRDQVSQDSRRRSGR